VLSPTSVARSLSCNAAATTSAALALQLAKNALVFANPVYPALGGIFPSWATDAWTEEYWRGVAFQHLSRWTGWLGPFLLLWPARVLAGMLLVAGTPVRVLGAGLSIATALGVAAIWFEPYRRARIFSFVNPWHDAQGAGFQTVQAMIGLGSGGIFGDGLGQGIQKVNYLPEAHTDMIFATIGEELGLVGTVGVIGAYAAFGWAGFRIALASKDPFGKLLATGLTVLICGQAAINLAAVLALAPLTGITLPFVSYGGSSLIAALGATGILLNIGSADAVEGRARVRDRGRGDRRPRAAVAGGGRSAAGARG